MTLAFLVVAVGVYFSPEVLPTLIGGTRGAWEYSAYGLEASFLWSVAFLLVNQFEARAVAAWGAFEALQRPVCRLAFPMDHPPQIDPGQSLCDAAFGVPMSALSVVAALGLAAVAQEFGRARSKRG